MPRTRRVGADESADILAEARRIVADQDKAALAPAVSLADLAEALADTFDESFTAERVVDMLAPAHRRALKSRLAAQRPAEARADAVEVWLPADVADRLRMIADQPVAAIRALLDGVQRDGGPTLPEPGSEEHCRRRRCSPLIQVSDPGRWACQTCGLDGRVDRPLNPVIKDRLADQPDRVATLRALAAELYEAWGGGERFTLADCIAHRRPAGRGEGRGDGQGEGRVNRDRIKSGLPELVEAGLLEEAAGPRGGVGYRVLEEPPDWVADAIAERREQREAEARVRDEQAAALRRVLEEGLTHTRPTGEVVEIVQNERGLELGFSSIPSWELREGMKRQGHCRWDGRRRRWCRTSPVTAVEPWLAAALDAGATVSPLGTADPDAEDWGYGDWSE
ncbi:hypothetical protein [Azospirillum sp. TSO35-2]|uniref:hypothetical protein n=1 Tax=Azospirillum sp. TSO35-2 TaxID=716796 RepID=UPI000D612EB3|nr:hypothetical protein [Azospirillum sp. TSO35-2]PWC35943.1 hypothetical protein TSO352_12085 [Azospirillum sp. TSO35-2]